MTINQLNGLYLGVAESSVRKRYLARNSINVSGEAFTNVQNSIDIKGPANRLTVKNAGTIAARVEPSISYNSMDIVAKSQDVMIQGVEILGRNKYQALNNIEIASRTNYKVQHSADIGSLRRDFSRNVLEVIGGESFLIIADVASEGIAAQTQGSELASSSIQIIDLGDADGGTFTLWLAYGGHNVETNPLPFNATAQEVEDALVELANVPTTQSIRVEGIVGVYTVYFENEMGNRYIPPIIIETLELENGEDAGTAYVQHGASAGMFAAQEVREALFINGEEVPLASFDYDEPDGKLGSILNVTLAYPDIAQVPANASISFLLYIRDGEDLSVVPLLEGGKLSGRNYDESWRTGVNGGPLDEVTFSAIDVMADKFTLAPRRPVIVYNPGWVNITDIDQDPANAIIDRSGNPIMPVLERVAGLTMRQILQRAYTNIGGYNLMTAIDSETMAKLARIQSYLNNGLTDQKGLGFDKVVTNIKDYEIRGSIEFEIDGGWHSGAQAVVGMYNPLYIPDGTTLFILDIEKPLPFGAVPRVIPISVPTRISQTLPFKVDTNGVMLTHKTTGFEDPTDDTFIRGKYVHEKPVSDGRTERRTRIHYLQTVRTATGEIVSQIPDEVYTETWAIGGSNHLIATETLKDKYDSDGLKTGYVKTTKGIVASGWAGHIALRDMTEETNETVWIDDPTKPGGKIQKSSTTLVRGLVFMSDRIVKRLNDAGQLVDSNLRFPAKVADQNGLIAETQGGQQLYWEYISGTFDTLRHLGGNQYDMEVVEVDMLTQNVRAGATSVRTGDPSTNPSKLRSKTMLIRDIESENEIGPRIPVSVNAGELPRDRALELADTVMYRTKNPLSKLTMPLALIDVSIKKGTVVIGQTRDAYTEKAIVVARRFTGESLQGKGRDINMTITAQELPKV